MNKFFLILLLASSSAFAWQDQDPNYGNIQQDAYGPGVHMDQYGRPVQIAPAYPRYGNQYNDSYIQVNPNVYGPGVHSDQYGRPIRTQPKY